MWGWCWKFPAVNAAPQVETARVMIHVLGGAWVELNNNVLGLPKEILHYAHDLPTWGKSAVVNTDGDVLPSHSVARNHLDPDAVNQESKGAVKAVAIVARHGTLTHPAAINLFPISHVYPVLSALPPGRLRG